MHFSWDVSLIKDVANVPPFLLAASGMNAVSPTSECKDQGCVATASNEYLLLPDHRYGWYAGLTLAMWFKPKAESGAGSTLMELGNGADKDGIKVARNGETDQVSLTVRLANGEVASTWSSGGGVWQPDVWKHLCWTLAPAAATGTAATWKMYVDGALVAQVAGAYPADGVYTQNYLGRGSGAGDGAFVGYLDSLVMFPDAISDDYVLFIFQVLCRVYYVCHVSCIAPVKFHITHPST